MLRRQVDFNSPNSVSGSLCVFGFFFNLNLKKETPGCLVLVKVDLRRREKDLGCSWATELEKMKSHLGKFVGMSDSGEPFSLETIQPRT